MHARSLGGRGACLEKAAQRGAVQPERIYSAGLKGGGAASTSPALHQAVLPRGPLGAAELQVHAGAGAGALLAPRLHLDLVAANALLQRGSNGRRGVDAGDGRGRDGGSLQ